MTDPTARNAPQTNHLSHPPRRAPGRPARPPEGFRSYRMKSPESLIIGSVIAGLTAIAALPGCAAPKGVTDPPAASAVELTPLPGGGTQTEMLADWDDAHPAVLAALSRCESAFAARAREGGPTDETATTLRYDLLTITEQPGTLTLSRAADPADGPVTVHIEVRIGDAGDPRFERCIAEAIAIRLRQLRGVGAAPLTWG